MEHTHSGNSGIEVSKSHPKIRLGAFGAICASALMVVLALALCACSGGSQEPSPKNESQASSSSQIASVTSSSSIASSGVDASRQATIAIMANGNRLIVDLEDNSSAKALVELLEKGPVTYTASDYGGFEKVGSLGTSLPANDRQIDTAPGDVILYQGDKVCIYYGNNSWSFTKLGHISDAGDIKDLLGEGDVEITLSLQ